MGPALIVKGSEGQYVTQSCETLSKTCLSERPLFMGPALVVKGSEGQYVTQSCETLSKTCLSDSILDSKITPYSVAK